MLRLEGYLIDCEPSLPSYCASGTCQWRQGSLHKPSCECFDPAASTSATSFQLRTNTCSNHSLQPHRHLHQTTTTTNLPPARLTTTSPPCLTIQKTSSSAQESPEPTTPSSTSILTTHTATQAWRAKVHRRHVQLRRAERTLPSPRP